MRHLILALVLVSFQSHADWQETHDKVMGSSESRELAPILETPAYQPQTYPNQPYQSDTDWTASVRAMDLEVQPRNGH